LGCVPAAEPGLGFRLWFLDSFKQEIQECRPIAPEQQPMAATWLVRAVYGGQPA